MKRKFNNPAVSKERLWLKAIDALDATFPLDLPLSPAARATEEAAVRKRKAEQANEALWAFGGKVREVEKEWRQLQDDMRQIKRPKSIVETTTYRGPLLLLNQYYWEQQLGANISRIKGENMFGINMFGSFNEMMQQYLAGSRFEPVGIPCARNAAPQGLDHNKDQSDSASSQQDVLTPRAAVAIGAASKQPTPHLETDSDSTSSSNVHCSPANRPGPSPSYQSYDLAEIEDVCRQQNWSHLPASKRFIKGRRFLKAARQQLNVQ